MVLTSRSSKIWLAALAANPGGHGVKRKMVSLAVNVERSVGPPHPSTAVNAFHRPSSRGSTLERAVESLLKIREHTHSIQSPRQPPIRSLAVAARNEVAARWGGPPGPRTDALVGPTAEDGRLLRTRVVPAYP